ncbi:GNAT family N-acetyltransferase [Nocardia sp. XZ_19_369]|uniref:GNAT family N-acetyltransferase n=1 Tax=Nocardia sp. XZ_19_369 TaxID=2769487 RepID=UPI00188E0780
MSGQLAANAADASLFQQSSGRIRRNLDDFVVAVKAGQHVGCAALQHHTRTNAEILAVAVVPDTQGRGAGGMLVRACMTEAARAGATFVWLATEKPDYFARYGFRRMSKWRLPLRIVLHKLWLVFEQPAPRWLPALFGRHTFTCRRSSVRTSFARSGCRRTIISVRRSAPRPT